MNFKLTEVGKEYQDLGDMEQGEYFLWEGNICQRFFLEDGEIDDLRQKSLWNFTKGELEVFDELEDVDVIPITIKEVKYAVI